MVFLGTGAAELLPNPYCECKICQNARYTNDFREKRRRSSLLLDNENLIDFGPDVPYACAQFGISLAGLRNIFLTHSHLDHMSFHTLFGLKTCVTEVPNIRVFMSRFVYDKLRGLESFAKEAGLNTDKHKEYLSKHCELVPLEFGKSFSVDDFSVIPLKTIHKAEFVGETGFNYFFERKGHTLLYGSDTGLYPDDNYEVLKGRRLDTLILEGTRGVGDFPINDKHLTFEGLKIMIDRLKRFGCVYHDTRIIITHICHKAMLTHVEYNALVKKEFGQNASVAYDGYEVPNVF